VGLRELELETLDFLVAVCVDHADLIVTVPLLVAGHLFEFNGVPAVQDHLEEFALDVLGERD